MVPVAGSKTSFGISMIMSGWMFQPSWKTRGAGPSLGLPSAVPPSAHATRVLISVSLNIRSLAKWPYAGSANQGGIFRAITAALMDFAHGRVSLYVRNDMGAISPGRWQVWQFAWSMGRTSL